ncbi:MAG: hypothetical protein COA84_07200 [Robiginitomaculum sp.]|nr:MAG: hypothetical protein COA84_07200 [Robiginitomaculum sp.]
MCESDIIVTANKRKSTLFNLPASVSVLTGDTIDAFGIENGRDAIRHFAGVTMTNLGAGRNKIWGCPR